MQVIHKPKPKPEMMMQTELLAYVHQIENENARLEELYQKSVGVIAARTAWSASDMTAM